MISVTYAGQTPIPSEYVDVDTGKKDQVKVKAGANVAIPPGLAHRFTAIEDAQVIEYYDGVFDAEDDIPFDFNS